MRKFIPAITCLFISIILSGCGLMEDAFKAGVIFALIIVAIIALVVWLARIVGRSVSKNMISPGTKMRSHATIRLHNSFNN
ncbi:MAG: hypothetical protein JSU01_23680 [Bacteroidetes bacterium]|nr:hypothetical protein [Bacteroidota bacterium]